MLPLSYINILGTFPDANCGPDTVVHDCCKMNPDAEGFTMKSGSNILVLCFICSYIPIIWVTKFGNQKEDMEKAKKDGTPPWVVNLPPIAKTIFHLGLLAIIAGFIVVPIVMAQSIQSSLNVNHRNALLGATAFMDPYR